RRIRPVREIAVIARTDPEDAHPIERDADRQRLPGHPGPDRGETGEMHQHEGDCRRIQDVVAVVFRGVVHIGIRVAHFHPRTRSPARLGTPTASPNDADGGASNRSTYYRGYRT